MSSLALIRLGNRGLLGCRLVQRHGIRERAPVVSSLIQNKQLSLTPVKNGRIYGPEEEYEKVEEIQHWKNERYVAVALLPIIPAALLFPNPVLDTALTAGVFLHTHWRLSGVVGDYIHGAILPKILKPMVLVISICAFGSMCYFNYTDIGFANAARTLFFEL